MRTCGIKTKGKLRLFLIFIVLLMNQLTFSQVNAGKIIFERKTNLEKKFGDEGMKRMMGENNKSKIDLFELYFNDTCSIFKPMLTDEADPMSWATNKNTVYQNNKSNQKLLLLSLFGQEIPVKDVNSPRNWKITESKRKIANYECYKAIWQKNDSTRIYAWFSVDIVPSVGPEGFNGLPGAILGLATEDGGIIYFAKSVEIMTPKAEVYNIDLGKKTVYTMQELKTKIEKDFGNSPRGKRMFDDLFRWM